MSRQKIAEEVVDHSGTLAFSAFTYHGATSARGRLQKVDRRICLLQAAPKMRSVAVADKQRVGPVCGKCQALLGSMIPEGLSIPGRKEASIHTHVGFIDLCIGHDCRRRFWIPPNGNHHRAETKSGNRDG